MDDVNDLDDLTELRARLTRFMMSYKFGLDEVTTKINILKEEFTRIHDYSPIEHVSSRLKTLESVLRKARRKGSTLDLDGIRDDVMDVAGVRVTCSFISDTYKIRDMLAQQQDLTVIREVDYIANPKPNGYKSLHLVVEVPVFMSDRVEPVRVEVQIRTIAMDFWASLEHKIYYKYDKEVPARLLNDLRQAAEAANRLDVEMERLHDEVLTLDGESGEAASTQGADAHLPESVLRAFLGRPEIS